MSLSLFDLSGRRALITGSSQGIGLALAAGLGRAGASGGAQRPRRGEARSCGRRACSGEGIERLIRGL